MHGKFADVHGSPFPSVPTIRLRAGAMGRLGELLGCRTEAEIADAIGMNQSQINRIKNGRCDINPLFLARLLLTLMKHGETVADYFDILDTQGYRYPIAVHCDERFARPRVATTTRRAS